MKGLEDLFFSLSLKFVFVEQGLCVSKQAQRTEKQTLGDGRISECLCKVSYVKVKPELVGNHLPDLLGSKVGEST